MIHLDTSFAVDLLREARRRRPGPAMALRSSLEHEVVSICVHAVCELLAGAELSASPAEERRRVLALCDAVNVVYPDERFAPAYGHLQASLQRTGRLVGTMDLLIATAAIVDSAPLVTRNEKEFRRVPGLRVIEY